MELKLREFPEQISLMPVYLFSKQDSVVNVARRLISLISLWHLY